MSISGHTTNRAPALPQSSTHPVDFCGIPQRLLTDLRDTPLAIGLYALIARLYLIYKEPIALSAADVRRFDPTVKYGAVLRALARLINHHWLIENTKPGYKTCYLPTWGVVDNNPLPWKAGDRTLGRPSHIKRICLPRDLLDVCMGKLVPHATRAAAITRYITTPALRLEDVGSYALTQAGFPRPTPALRWLQLVGDEAAYQLPGEATLLARISQRTLFPDIEGIPNTALNLNGACKMGMVPVPPDSDGASGQPLFFIDQTLIGKVTSILIGRVIGSEAKQQEPFSAAECAEKPILAHTPDITWESRDSRESEILPPNPPNSQQQLGEDHYVNKIVFQEPTNSPAIIEHDRQSENFKDLPPVNTESDNIPPANTESDNIPPVNTESDNIPPVNTESDNIPPANTESDNVPPANTESDTVLLLRSVGVSAVMIKKLADQPSERVRAAIAYARDHARNKQSIAGLVVYLVQAERDGQQDIPRSDPGVDEYTAALRAWMAQIRAENQAQEEAVAAAALTPDEVPGAEVERDLTTWLREELKIGTPRSLYPLIGQLVGKVLPDGTVLVACGSVSNMQIAYAQLLPAIRRVCSDGGWPIDKLRLVVALAVQR